MVEKNEKVTKYFIPLLGDLAIKKSGHGVAGLDGPDD